MNNGFDNNNNGGPSTGTNGKFDFFPPDDNMNGNNQGMQQNNNGGMGFNQNMNSSNVNSSNINGSVMQNTYTGVDYMNNGNNANNAMNNSNQMNGMQDGMAQQGMQQQSMPQMGMSQNSMGQPNMSQLGIPQPGIQQPMQMGFGNQPGAGNQPKKGVNKSIIFGAIGLVAVIVLIVVFAGNGGKSLTCTAEQDIDGGKQIMKSEIKVTKGGHKVIVKSEYRYEFDKLEDEDMKKVFQEVDIYGGTQLSPNYDNFDVNGTSEIGKSYLGDNTVITRKGNTAIVTAETTQEDENDKIEKEDIEELKKTLEDSGLTCK